MTNPALPSQPAPPSPSAAAQRPFAREAARASWVAPLIALGTTVLFGRQHPVACVLLEVALVLTGLLLGVVALFGLRRHGKEGILVPALAGIAANGLFALLLASIFVANQR